MLGKVKAEAIIHVKPEYIIVPEDAPKKENKKRNPKVRRRIRRERYVAPDSSEDSSEDEPVAPAPYQNPIVVPKVNFAELSEAEKESEFWKDVITTNARGTAFVAKMDDARREHFKISYFKYYDMMNERLRSDEMFKRNEVDSLATQASIISYSIGEGREVFNNLFDDLDLYQNLIAIGEYTNFENKLPVDMQH